MSAAPTTWCLLHAVFPSEAGQCMPARDTVCMDGFVNEFVLAMPVSQAARALGVSQRTIRRWVKAGKLRAIRPGGPNAPLLVLAWSLNDLLEAGQT
jgi:excisionase family DNA binding protein